MNPERSPVRVLLVEDDRAISQALNIRLAAHGFDVTVAADGGDAIRLGRELQPDLLLLDINLPTVDGFKVAESIRGSIGQVPTVFMTALRDTFHSPMAREMESTWYLEKPFTTPFLLHVVRSAAEA